MQSDSAKYLQMATVRLKATYGRRPRLPGRNGCSLVLATGRAAGKHACTGYCLCVGAVLQLSARQGGFGMGVSSSQVAHLVGGGLALGCTYQEPGCPNQRMGIFCEVAFIHHRVPVADLSFSFATSAWVLLCITLDKTKIRWRVPSSLRS